MYVGKQLIHQDGWHSEPGHGCYRVIRRAKKQVSTWQQTLTPILVDNKHVLLFLPLCHPPTLIGLERDEMDGIPVQSNELFSDLEMGEATDKGRGSRRAAKGKK